MTEEKIRIIVADDHKIVLDGLEATLKPVEDIEILATALDGKQVMVLLEVYKPNIVVLDISMPKMDGLETLKAIKEKYPNIKVLILTMHNDHQRILQSFQGLAEGYILKNRSRSDLVDAIRKIHAGGSAWGPEVTQKFMEAMANQRNKPLPENPIITDREREVLELMADGMTSKEIADHLCLAKTTIDTHKKNLMSKLGLKNSNLLVRYAVENGIVRK